MTDATNFSITFIRDLAASYAAKSDGSGSEIAGKLSVAADDIERLDTKYHELIMEVQNKYPDESRHETALRYIRERENKPSEYGSQSVPDQGNGDV